MEINTHISPNDFNPDFVATIVSSNLQNDLIQIVLDTGCKFSITQDWNHFITYHSSPSISVAQTAGGPTIIEGHGMVNLTLCSQHLSPGNFVSIDQ
jgi:hypothetical protein